MVVLIQIYYLRKTTKSVEKVTCVTKSVEKVTSSNDHSVCCCVWS